MIMRGFSASAGAPITGFAPKEIKKLIRDFQGLRKLLENLENSLNSTETQRIVDQDEDIRRSMEGLKELIETCDGACGEVIQSLKPYSQKGGFQVETKRGSTERLISIQWFFKRRSILASVDDLQRSKFLLSDSMGSATLILMLKIAALRDDTIIEARSMTRKFDDDVGSAIVEWFGAVIEHPTPSETASLSNLSLLQQTSLQESDHLTDELVGAVRRGTIPVVKLLLEYVDVDSQDARYGRTALSIAAETGDVEMATVLLNHGASVNIRQYSRSCWDDDWGPHWMAGRLPLNWTAVEGNSEIVELLLKHGPKPNSATSGGRSALQDACWKEDQRSMRLLLEYGADVNFQSFHHGWRPIYEAAKANRTELVQLLLVQPSP